ncbi:hypothetical protein BGZ83_000115 [Gryganskiella cystojenkinii]|nr:hypothetical protein BGZ83_000115 [Gryganskiella cystojenkinii]
MVATVQEKIADALNNKDLGNEAFKNNDIKKALMQYHLAVLGLSGLDNQMAGMPMMSSVKPQEGGAVNDTQKSEIKSNLAVVYSNMGACHLKNANYKRAIEVCTTALKHDPNNVKAKFRRAQAKLGEGNLAGAEADLTALGDKVPGVKQELEKLKKKYKEQDDKQRKTLGGFLSRGRIIDEEEEANENAQSETATSSSAPAASAATSSAPKTTPKSKPTLATKLNSTTRSKPKPVVKEEEYTPSTWSGTAPKIQELAEGEE